MTRPCKVDHVVPLPLQCEICKRLALPGERGDWYRNHYGEPDFQVIPDSVIPAIHPMLARFMPQKCKHLGEPTGETRGCEGCGNIQKIERLYYCNHPNKEKHPLCTIGMAVVKDVQPCKNCSDNESTHPRRKLLLSNKQSPGDILVMMTAVQMLHEQYPNQFLTKIESPRPDVYRFDPYATAQAGDNWERIEMHYPGINDLHFRPVHFMQCYVEYLASQLGIPIQLKTTHPRLVLSPQETMTRPSIKELPDKYALIIPGVKQDFTAKGWGHHHYQKVVDKLKGVVQFVQIGQIHHLHKPLSGVINLLGNSAVERRGFIHIANHAQFGIGPNTYLQHVMAALRKPYLCLMGAREHRVFNEYPTQISFSTQGRLSCPAIDQYPGKACWRSRTVPLGDGDDKDLPQNLCALPVIKEGCEAVPKCMDIIRPEEVVAAIRGLYDNGVIHA